ncbi:MAG: TPM domain-containing protein [Bacteroidota bacterium]
MPIPARHFFTEQEQQEITRAIREAELNTSGEIRVHVENSCKGDVLDRAAYIFKQLSMHRTQLRNGVLFHLSVHDHKFAILGDVGINQRVPPTFWDEIKEEMAARFREGNMVFGLVDGILKAGEQLKTHFPYQKDGINELSDELSFGER